MIIRAFILAGLLAGSASADNVDVLSGMNFTGIGEAGNSADGSNNSYGSVGYNYDIGTREVTSDQFFQSGIGGGSAGVNTPVVSITWHEAARFANWLTSGNDTLGAYTIVGGDVTGIDRSSAISTYGTAYVLPTTDEWYKAAYHVGGGVYSTYAANPDVQPVAGTQSNYDGTNQGLTTLWDVGTGTLSEQNGTKDMMGNAWEWAETERESGKAFIWGGSHLTGSGASGLRNTGSTSQTLSNPSNQLGFRVVAIPEPGTISLMSLSTITLFFTRTARRRKLAGRSLLPVRHEHFCDACCSVDEWNASFVDEAEVAGYLEPVKEAVLPSFRSAWSKAYGSYKKADRTFWNHMVAVHESRTLARKAFNKAFKQKTLACFDGFLSLFMK